MAQGQGTKFDARIGKLEGSLQLLQADVDSLRQGKGLLGGAAAMLRADRQPSLIDPDTQLKFEALGKQQGSDAARLGATVAKLTMRWGLGSPGDVQCTHLTPSESCPAGLPVTLSPSIPVGRSLCP